MIWEVLKRFEPLVAWVVILFLLGWSGYVTFIKPHTNPLHTTWESASSIDHYQPRVGIGCAVFNIPPDVVKK